MNDPVKHCKLYKEIGFSHVDGMLCDFPECSMLKDYEESNLNKWIKPSELPKKFHGKCFVAWKSNFNLTETTTAQIYTLQNYMSGAIPKWWSEGSQSWEYADDKQYRVMIIDIPAIPKDLFEE